MLKKIFAFLIVLYPILSAYSIIGPIDLGVALCGLAASLLFAAGGGSYIRWPKGWKVFLIYVGIAAILVSHTFPSRLILYSFLLIIGCSLCNLKLLYKYYKGTAIVCIIFFLFQEFISTTTGVKIPGIITFLPTIYGDSDAFIAANILTSERSSSLFLEASYFAQYIFPLIVLELFWNQKHTGIRNALLLSIVIFLIRSGNGIILLFLIWGTWLLVGKVKKSTKRYVIFGSSIIIISIIILMPSMVLELLNRSSELVISNGGGRWNSSGFIRFWRGYFLYSSFPPINQIFGMNPSLIKYYMIQNPLFDQDIETVFINGIQTILCYYGAIGLFFVMRHLYLIRKKSSYAVRTLLFCTTYLLLSESYFISSRMLFVIVLAYLLKNEYHENPISN